MFLTSGYLSGDLSSNFFKTAIRKDLHSARKVYFCLSESSFASSSLDAENPAGVYLISFTFKIHFCNSSYRQSRRHNVSLYKSGQQILNQASKISGIRNDNIG